MIQLGKTKAHPDPQIYTKTDFVPQRTKLIKLKSLNRVEKDWVNERNKDVKIPTNNFSLNPKLKNTFTQKIITKKNVARVE